MPKAKKKPDKYMAADDLHILPEEHKALIAFVKAPNLGRIVEIDGKTHYYDQRHATHPSQAVEHDCNTAGCVAGFVFAHAKFVQKKRALRGNRNAHDYLREAVHCGGFLLSDLYHQGNEFKVATAKEVVRHALMTGKVDWPRSDLRYD